MFESLKRRGIGVRIINATTKLYTQEQMDEKDKRVKELWEALNEAHAVLDVYGHSIEHTIEYKTLFGTPMTEDQVDEEVLRSCKKLLDTASKIHSTMLKL